MSAPIAISRHIFHFFLLISPFDVFYVNFSHAARFWVCVMFGSNCFNVYRLFVIISIASIAIIIIFIIVISFEAKPQQRQPQKNTLQNKTNIRHSSLLSNENFNVNARTHTQRTNRMHWESPVQCARAVISTHNYPLRIECIQSKFVRMRSRFSFIFISIETERMDEWAIQHASMPAHTHTHTLTLVHCPYICQNII